MGILSRQASSHMEEEPCDRLTVQTPAVISVPSKNSRAKAKVGTWTLPSVPPARYCRVKMLRSQICNSDRRVLAGTKTGDANHQPVVLGHEGIGRVFQVNKCSQYQVGDLVVLGPHFVEPDDEMLAAGLPNLSKKMKHLGIHMNGTFADYMDFPEYTIFKIPECDEPENTESYYDQMVMIEPLACVHRGYKLLEYTDSKNTVLILGGGPMGVLHAIHLQRRYPASEVTIFDNDPRRRALVRSLKGLKAVVVDQLNLNSQFDLVIPVTSDWVANTVDAVHHVKNYGTVLLFSGIDGCSEINRPVVAGVDIEVVHRYEHSVRIMKFELFGGKKTFDVMGTSGYVHDDFQSAVEDLREDFFGGGEVLYSKVSTAVIEGLDGTTVFDQSGLHDDAVFNEPALGPLLELHDDGMTGAFNVHNYLKILVRHGKLEVL